MNNLRTFERIVRTMMDFSSHGIWETVANRIILDNTIMSAYGASMVNARDNILPVMRFRVEDPSYFDSKVQRYFEHNYESNEDLFAKDILKFVFEVFCYLYQEQLQYTIVGDLKLGLNNFMLEVTSIIHKKAYIPIVSDGRIDSTLEYSLNYCGLKYKEFVSYKGNSVYYREAYNCLLFANCLVYSLKYLTNTESAYFRYTLTDGAIAKIFHGAVQYVMAGAVVADRQYIEPDLYPYPGIREIVQDMIRGLGNYRTHTAYVSMYIGMMEGVIHRAYADAVESQKTGWNKHFFVKYEKEKECKKDKDFKNRVKEMRDSLSDQEDANKDKSSGTLRSNKVSETHFDKETPGDRLDSDPDEITRRTVSEVIPVGLNQVVQSLSGQEEKQCEILCEKEEEAEKKED